MKKTRTKLLSLLVVLCMVLTLLPMAALAADAQFTDMPNDYSTAALQAAVTNGLLKGSGGKLRPAANLTRAEMATILNHAFGATEKGDISGYTDVPADAWYANEMAVAVHMKTLVGSGKKLNPSAPVTRQEALTALASVLKLPAGSDTALAKFADSAKVASWAKSSVAAMAAAGYAGGDGANLNPTANITRADFAVIMNSVVKTYITKAGTYTDNLTGSVMVNVPGVVLKNITITGDLIIGDGVGSGDITLDGVTVTGRTVVRGGGVHSVKIINKSNVGTLTISKVDGEIRVAADASSSVEVVVINDGKDDVIVEGNVDKLEVAAAGVPVTVQGGTVGEVSVTADHASVTVAASATVTTLTATGAQPTLTVQGTVTTLTADKTATGATVTVAKGAKVGTVNAAAEGAAISGEGTVTNANVTGNNVNVATSGTSVTVAKDVTGAKSGDKDLKGGTTTTTTGSTSPAAPSGPSYATYSVESFEEFTDALSKASSGDHISLKANILIPKDLAADKAVSISKAVTLDLNGKTLTGGNTNIRNIDVASGGALTLIDSADTDKNGGNGKIITDTDFTSGTSGASYGIIEVLNGGSFTMNSGEISAARATPLTNGQYGVGVNGKAAVTINGGKIEAGWYAVSGNGASAAQDGTTVTVNGGTLHSTMDYAIYNPQDGTVTINGGVVGGAAGAVCMRDGNLTVNGGTISSEGTGNTGDWGDGTGNLNNFAIALPDNTANAYGIATATIKGGTFSASGNANTCYKGTSAALTIKGGAFSDLSGIAYAASASNYTLNADCTIPSGTITLPTGATLTVASCATLTVASCATLTVASGATLVNNGTLNIAGTLTKDGVVTENGRIVVQGSLVMGSGSAYNNDGIITVSNGGSFTDNRADNTYPITSTGYIQYITGSKGLVDGTEYIGTTDADEFQMAGDVVILFQNEKYEYTGNGQTQTEIRPTMSIGAVKDGGTVTFNGQPAAPEGGARGVRLIGENSDLTVSQKVTLTINTGAELDVAGRLCVGGTLNNLGKIDVKENSESSVGQIIIGGQTESGPVSGTVTSSGAITNNGIILYAAGSLTSSGTIEGKGCFLVCDETNLEAAAAYAPTGSCIAPVSNINIDKNIVLAHATLMLTQQGALTLTPVSGTDTVGRITGRIWAYGGTLRTPTSISGNTVTYGKMIGPAGSTDAAYVTSDAVFDMKAEGITIESGDVTVGVSNYGTNDMTLTLNSGASFTVPSGTTFDTWGSLNINGTLTVNGSLIFSNGTVNIGSTGVITGATNATITVKNGVTVTGTGANGIAAKPYDADTTYHWSNSAWTNP